MAEKQDSRSNLLNGNVFKTMLSLSVPAILGMVVIGLYNFMDAVFVGRMVGPEAMTAVKVSYPFTLLNSGIATLIGTGSASVLSRAVGRKDQGTINQIMGNLIALIVLLSLIINSLRMAWMYCIIGGREQQVRLYFGCWNWRLFYLPKSSNISETLANESDRNTLKTLQEFNCSVGLPLFFDTFERPSETLLENRHFLRSNSIRSLQIENEKGPDRHPIFVNQMYNLVKPLAHPAGFEPTACRLGVLAGRLS